MSFSLEKAYEYCENVTKTHAKSFYFAAKFLPKDKQRPIYALYALCRHVDDEIDEITEESSEAEAIQAVEKWRTELKNIYELVGKGEDLSPEKAENAVFLVWHDVLKKYKIPLELPLELMKGVLMDTRIKRYETFDELYVYCYRVASTVGLMSSEIFGYTGGQQTLDYAEALGIAMQLTNILRDVGEDAEMGRIYVPQEDLQKFGITEEQIFSRRFDDNFLELMKFEIERAREYYRRAENGIPFLTPETRFTVLLALRLYSNILNEIERQNYNVFKRRAHTTKTQKILSIPSVWLESRKLIR
jgi:15-cis-phytoene synthase